MKKIEGQTPIQKRNRLAIAIVNKLRDDEMLRHDVALQLGLDSDQLDLDVVSENEVSMSYESF
mgnify:FL=1